MGTELLPTLVEATLASSTATATVLLLRAAVGRCFGALARYRLWLLVPLAVAAVLLPAPVALPATDATLLRSIADAAVATQPLLVAAPPLRGAGALAIAAWSLGAFGFGLLLWRQQRRYLAAMRPGPAEPTPVHPGLSNWRRAAVAGAPPALIGALRPWLLLPADFEQRYDAGERQLVLTHEYQHLRHRDGLSNLLAAALRALFWFNPLLHFAVSRMRFDQELACDAAVMRHHAAQRRRYADAMLKTQLACATVPIGCHWQASHPLKERIAMLKRPLPNPRARVIGNLAIACLLGAGMAAAWAAQPPRVLDAASAPVVSGQSAGPSALDDVAAPAGAETAPATTVLPGRRPPRYPADAIESGQEGKVVLRILVGVDGRAKVIEVDQEQTRAADSLVASSIEAVNGWTFQPHQVDGRVVEGWVQVPIEFSLDRAVANYSRITHIEYPQTAQAKRIEGEVVLAVAVAPSGAPSNVRVVHEEPAGVFGADMAELVRREWRFNPATVDDEAVASVVQVPILFRLGDSPSAPIALPPGAALDQLEVRAE